MNYTDIHKKISPTGWGFFLALISTLAHADMNDCVRMTDADKKNMCMATYSGSSTFCDKIKNFGDRTQCMRMVIAKQRKEQYGTVKPQEEKKGE
jgi:hypothetical protein